jgi:acetylglutamate kinase
MQQNINTAKTLLEALPFIREFYGQKVVIKYGGAAQVNPELKEKFAEDIMLMYLVGIKPIIIHGGGFRITELLKKLEIHSEFIDGQRVTNKEAMRIVEMVLSGDINKEIVSMLNHHGAKAIGINGKDANFIEAEAKDGGKFGFTGLITNIKADVIDNLISEKFIPVIAPISAGESLGHPGFNINADIAACEIAIALKAKKVLFLTDTAGVLGANGKLLDSLTGIEVEELKDRGVISGGMIPKVDSCIKAVRNGVEKAHIIDGRVEHSILLELFTQGGVGTEIMKAT